MNFGEVIASIAAAIIGMENLYEPIQKSVVTLSGSIVTVPGTIDISSKLYALLIRSFGFVSNRIISPY